MKLRKITALVLALILALTASSVTAFAEGGTDLTEGFDILFDGEFWRAYPIDSKEDEIYLSDLNITLTDTEGRIVPQDACDLIGGTLVWDDEKQEDIFTPMDEPYSLTVNEDYMQSGFGGFGVYAVAKDGSGYTGETEPREFMLWHKYSFNWFGANADFGEEYMGQCTWSWHDYYAIPADRIEEPVIHGIAYEDVDPQYYEITYFERGERPDFDDPEYDQKLYPETDPLDGLPTEPGSYFARIDGKEPYYGTSYVDFDVVESFAMVRGSDRRYYDGDTIYLNKGEEAFICFDTEPYSGLIPGWRNDLLKNDGFTIEDDPRFFEGDDYAYAHVTAKDLQADTVGTLYYGWYLYDDVFDRFGGMHWDTAVPVMTCSVRIAVAPDEVDYYLGDVDGDGDITIMDVTLLQRSLAGLKLDDDSTLMQADVDGNGTLESVDVTFIQRRLAKMKVPFDVGKPMVKD